MLGRKARARMSVKVGILSYEEDARGGYEAWNGTGADDV